MRSLLSRDQLYVTVDLLILSVRDGRLVLLLSRRTTSPFDGRWALPGRFVGLDESAETAAQTPERPPPQTIRSDSSSTFLTTFEFCSVSIVLTWA